MFKGDWNKKLSKLFIYLSGYVSFIAFAIVGGYAICKSDDEELRNTTKKVFIVSLFYYTILAVISIFVYFGSMSSNFYGSNFYNFLSVLKNIVEIVKIGVYAFLIIWELVKTSGKKDLNKKEENNALVEAEVVSEDDTTNND